MTLGLCLRNPDVIWMMSLTQNSPSRNRCSRHRRVGATGETQEDQALMNPIKITHVDAWLLDYARPRGGVVTVRDGEYMVG